MRAFSTFTGIGGLDLGLERAGIECVGQVEIDESCNTLLRRRWPDVPRWTDMREVDPDDLPTFDVLHGGFPCQDVSLAGRRRGLVGERSGLFHEYARIVTALRPNWVLLENVPGLLSSNRGEDFATILRILVRRGYRVEWRILDAQYHGVAQRRRRVFIIGSLGGGSTPWPVLLEPPCRVGDPPARRGAGQEVAGTLAARIDGGGFPGTDEAAGGYLTVSFTTSDMDRAKTEHTGPLTSDNHGAVPIAFTVNQREEARELDDLSVALLGDRFGSAHGETLLAGEASMALTSRMNRDDGESQTFIAFTERGRANGRNVEVEPDPDVVGALMSGVGSTARARRLATATGVRRLTPLECERLQGLPDGWTEGFSDTTRYRMIGNAVAVPVAEWVGRRLAGAHLHR